MMSDGLKPDSVVESEQAKQKQAAKQKTVGGESKQTTRCTTEERKRNVVIKKTKARKRRAFDCFTRAQWDVFHATKDGDADHIITHMLQPQGDGDKSGYAPFLEWVTAAMVSKRVNHSACQRFIVSLVIFLTRNLYSRDKACESARNIMHYFAMTRGMSLACSSQHPTLLLLVMWQHEHRHMRQATDREMCVCARQEARLNTARREFNRNKALQVVLNTSCEVVNCDKHLQPKYTGRFSKHDGALAHVMDWVKGGCTLTDDDTPLIDLATSVGITLTRMRVLAVVAALANDGAVGPTSPGVAFCIRVLEHLLARDAEMGAAMWVEARYHTSLDYPSKILPTLAIDLVLDVVFGMYRLLHRHYYRLMVRVLAAVKRAIVSILGADEADVVQNSKRGCWSRCEWTLLVLIQKVCRDKLLPRP